jgi:hypothetical protein
MRHARISALVLVGSLLTACGGASSMSSPGTAAMPPSVPTSVPQPPSSQTANVSFRIVVPAKASTTSLHPAYVSASTQSASISVTAPGGNPGTPTVVNCTSVCSGSVNAPVATDTFTVNLYDAKNAAGNLLSTGITTQAILLGKANSVNVTFNGVVASLSVAIASVVTPGTAGSVGVIVNALDADRNVIVGPGSYANASGNPVTVALSDSDTSGNSSLSQSSITQPTSGITLNYTANFDANPTISASASGLTTASATVAFPKPTLSALSPISVTAGTAVSETLSGTNFVAGGTTVSAGSSVTGITVSNVKVSGPGTLTATFTISGSALFGSQNVTVTTAAGTSGAQSITQTFAVTVFTDTAPGSPPGTGGGNAGDLRSAIISAESVSGAHITFSGCTPSAPCTIALNGPLPLLDESTTIDGGSYGSVIINGQGKYRVFWAYATTSTPATIVLANLEIENALAQGGNGGGSGSSGGGGAGLGAGLFVDGTATVSVMNDAFNSDSVVGGNGGSPSTTTVDGGGGGGLGGNGGSATLGTGGGGGGGIVSAGQNDTAAGGGTGGAGYTGTGGGTSGAFSSTGNAGGGGAGSYGGGGGGGGDSTAAGGGIGGTGGTGGGGGGGGAGAAGSGPGAPGGVGGGGGAGGLFAAGANGSVGGGGGAAGEGSGGIGVGGALSTTLNGGNGGSSSSSVNGGGGGAAAGPAIFVNSGTLTIVNSFANSCTATGGAGGVGSGSAASGGKGGPGGSDATPVFNFGGTVDGVSVSPGSGGPVSGALPTGTP